MADFTRIRPANDIAALELSSWCSGLLSQISEFNHIVRHDLYASAATRIRVEEGLSGVRCVLFFGHGTETELLGARYSALIDTLNIESASRAIVFAVACSSASVLGTFAVSKGVECYLGFDGPLVWISRDPEDQFQPAATRGILRLIHGGTTGGALEEMTAAFGDVADYYLNGKGKGKSNSTIGWLAAFWNQKHLQLHGSGGATL
jgi:hypothetical protein